MRAIVVDDRVRMARAVVPYGVSLFWVAVAVSITLYFGHSVVGFAPLLLAAVMYSAWRSGMGPGLAAAGVATLATAYFLAEPLHSLEVNEANGPRVVIFLMVAVLGVVFHAPRRLANVFAPAAAPVEPVKPEPVACEVETADLYELVDAALRTRVSEIDEKGLQLSVHLEAERRQVAGDPERLRELFCMLLGNAISSTDPGGTIVISATNSHAGDLEIEVADTGEGIEEELLPYVFECGGQEMVMCKAIVDAHGGRIAAYSPGRGEGAAFVVRLPAVG